MEGMLSPDVEEKIICKYVEVRETFKYQKSELLLEIWLLMVQLQEKVR